MRSTLHAICPACQKKALIEEHADDRMTCSACSFAYRDLATDAARLDAFLVSHLRSDSMGLLVAFEMNRRLKALPNLESIQQIRDLAAKNGIALPIPADENRARNIALVFTLLAMLSVALYAFVASR